MIKCISHSCICRKSGSALGVGLGDGILHLTLTQGPGLQGFRVSSYPAYVLLMMDNMGTKKPEKACRDIQNLRSNVAYVSHTHIPSVKANHMAPFKISRNGKYTLLTVNS